MMIFPILFASAVAAPSPVAQSSEVAPEQSGRAISLDDRDCSVATFGEARVHADRLAEKGREIAELEGKVHDQAELRDTSAAQAKTLKATLEESDASWKEDDAAFQAKVAPLTTKLAQIASRRGPLDPAKNMKELADLDAEEAKLKIAKLELEAASNLAARKKELDKQRKQLAQLEAAQADAKAAIAEALKQIEELKTLQSGIERKLDAQIVLSKKDAVRPRVKRQLKRCVRLRQNERIEAQIEAETRTFRGAMKDARASRCSTAICWGPSNKFAFEVLAEIPIGKSFAFPPSGLARYVNGSDIGVSFSAGLRFWSHWDWFSVAVFLSKPLITQNEIIHVSGSTHNFTTSQVRRPFPGIGVGLFGDILWLSIDYDQLRNGNSGDLRAPEFRPNDVVSHTGTITLAIAPVAGIRNGLGTLSQKNKREEAEKKALDDAARMKAEADAAARQAAEKAAAEKAAAEKAAAEEGPSEEGPATKPTTETPNADIGAAPRPRWARLERVIK